MCSFVACCDAQIYSTDVATETGETGWKGANKVYVKNELIVASVLQMNDYYERDMDSDEVSPSMYFRHIDWVDHQ